MQMLGNRVAIEVLNKSTDKKSFLQMPDDSFNTGRVRYLGPECAGLEVGQLVLFGNQRESVKVEGMEFLIMEDSNVFGILNGEKGSDK